MQAATSVSEFEVMAQSSPLVMECSFDELPTHIEVRRGGKPAALAWLRLSSGAVLSCSEAGRATTLGSLPLGYPVQPVEFVDGAWVPNGPPLLLVDTDTGAADQALLLR